MNSFHELQPEFGRIASEPMHALCGNVLLDQHTAPVDSLRLWTDFN